MVLFSMLLAGSCLLSGIIAKPLSEADQYLIVDESYVRHVSSSRPLISAYSGDIHTQGFFDDFLVPLSSSVGKNQDFLVIEQAILNTLGPRFVNALYANATADGLHEEIVDNSCLNIKCGTTVAKISPCIALALLTRDPKKLLACAKKDDLCNCIGCLPAKLRDLVQKFVCKSSLDELDIPTINMVDLTRQIEAFEYFAFQSPFLKAFRGDLPTRFVDLADNLGGCYAGFPVGGECDCCLGIPVPDEDGDASKKSNCLGACINPGDQFTKRKSVKISDEL